MPALLTRHAIAAGRECRFEPDLPWAAEDGHLALKLDHTYDAEV